MQSITFSVKWKLIVTMMPLLITLIGGFIWTQVNAQKAILESQFAERKALMWGALFQHGRSSAIQLAKRIEDKLAVKEWSAVDPLISSAVNDDPEISHAIWLEQVEDEQVIRFNSAFDSEVVNQKVTDSNSLRATAVEEVTVLEREQRGAGVAIPLRVGKSFRGTLRLFFDFETLEAKVLSEKAKIDSSVYDMIFDAIYQSSGFLAICFIVTYIFASKSSRPIIRLTSSVQKLSDGDFSSAKNMRIHSNDEVGMLSLRFVEMSESLQESYEQLAESHRRLEQRVTKRTEELNANNRSLLETNAKLSDEVVERKRIEQVLRESEHKLQEATQTALLASQAKGDFLANMSHEIRTPINGVIGMTDLLLSTKLNPKQQKFVETARSSGKSLLAVVNDILDFSKIESGYFEISNTSFNLIDMVSDTLDMMAVHAYSKKLELGCVIEPGVPTNLVSDGNRIQQVLLNLISNAVKFTDYGSIGIYISPGKKFDDGTMMMEFSVIDTGIGIDQETQDRLFHPFTQADSSTARKYGGTGLGLSISRRLVKMMGGDLFVVSRRGSGSRFTFSIKMSESDIIEPPGADLAGIRILAAIPSTVTRMAVQSIFRQVNAECDYLDSWQKVEEMKAAGQLEAYSVIYIDETLPGLKGQDLSTLSVGSIPVVGITSPEFSSKISSVDGKNQQVFKPVNYRNLLNTISLTLGINVRCTKACPSLVQIKRQINIGKVFNGLSILVVEDQVVNQEVLLAQLEVFGCNADMVENGLEAIEITKKKQYDLILMDCQMPKMDGYSATERIRTMKGNPNRYTPIVAITAHVMKGEKDKCYAAGMNDYLSKPVAPQLLQTTIYKWVHGGQGEIVEDVSVPKKVENSYENPFDLEWVYHSVTKDTTRVEKYLRLFVNANQKLFEEEMPDALAAKNRPSLKMIFHRLKGTCSSLGAHKMSSIAEVAEAAVSKSDFERIREYCRELDRWFDATKTFVKNL